MAIQDNTEALEALLEQAEALPNAEGGTAAPVLTTETVTPGASEIIITPPLGFDGYSKVKIRGDADLVSQNIAAGVEIFGVIGTFTGGGTSSNVETLQGKLLTSAPFDAGTIHYTDANMRFQQISYEMVLDGVSFEIAANTLVYVSVESGGFVGGTNSRLLSSENGRYVFLPIADNFTIS